MGASGAQPMASQVDQNSPKALIRQHKNAEKRRMAPQERQTSMCPMRFDREVLNGHNGLDPDNRWECSLCLCHLAAAKQVVKGPSAADRLKAVAELYPDLLLQKLQR